MFGVNTANLQYNTPIHLHLAQGSVQSYAFIDMMRESCKECVGAQTL
ncbi:hypothetical protein E5E12_04260 [Helicobacter pylori]|nr:hypothetical protein [Helicobacter pylori]WRG82087.1 hypothetical protein E5E12_04260 [Helicobacter pylori]